MLKINQFLCPKTKDLPFSILIWNYCKCYFRGGFIFMNFASQSLHKNFNFDMAIYSNENIKNIGKLSYREFPHLVQNRERGTGRF